MSTPFLGEVRIVSFNFAPKGWALCNGQLLPINTNQALFSILGTTYGGNGQTTFALPDLRGRAVMGMDNGHTEGERSGEEAHTLIAGELPQHTHLAGCSSQPGNQASPVGHVFAKESAGVSAPYAATANAQANATLSSGVGGSQAHENRQPYLTVNFVIALTGIFPSRN